MVNKEKLLANAQKMLAKGQVSKAISEYQTLIGAFPKDVRNRQKLAELLSRDKRSDEALTEYTAVARHYTDTGFYLKAIAVFKQMQKIDPSRVDIYHRLAELNEKQGLVGNALSEYRNLVAYYDKHAMYREATDVLDKMLALDPDNLNFSAKIAEYHLASGREEEAYEKFQEIIASLVVNSEHARIIKLYERFLEICPEDGTARLPLARALLNSGSTEKAIQVLKNLLKHSPENPDINRCLTDAYVAAEDFANARLTLKHLLKQKKDDLDLLAYYVRICLDAGETERARDRLEEWRDAFAQAGRLSVLQGFYRELAGKLADDAQVAASLAAICEALGDTVAAEEMDTSATAVGTCDTGDDEGSEITITDVAADAMVDGDALNDDVSALEAKPFNQPLDVNPAAVGVELELDFDLAMDGPSPRADVAAVTAKPLPVDAEDDTPDLNAEEDVEIEVELDLDDLGDLELDFAEEAATEEELTVDEEIRIAPPEESVEMAVTLPLPDADEFEESFAAEDELSLDGDFDLEIPEEAEEIVVTDQPEELGELEELDELEELEALNELEGLEELDELEDLEELDDVAAPAVIAASGQSAFCASINVEAELEEAQYYLQQGLYDDATRVVRTLLECHPTRPELQDKLAEINQGRQAAESESDNAAFADLMAGLQDDDLSAAADFLDSFGSPGRADDELSQITVAELDSSDTESYYNLGIAYKEMGLYDDAIAEFSKASKDPVRSIDCAVLTGQCHLEAGDAAAAMATFRSGLSLAGLGDEGRMTLNFEMGMLHQMNGELLDALDCFQRVAEIDSFYRDVAVLIKSLRRELGLDDSEDDGGPQGNRDRVSYV